MANTSAYLANSRLFPPVFRSTAFGLCNLVSHLVAIMAPMLAEVHDPIPFIVFVILTVVAMIATGFLVEMHNEEGNHK